MPVAIKQETLKMDQVEKLRNGYRKANEEDESQLIKEEEKESFVVDMVQNEGASSSKNSG